MELIDSRDVETKPSASKTGSDISSVLTANSQGSLPKGAHSETCGGMGTEAYDFCCELLKRWRERQCKETDDNDIERQDSTTWFKSNLLCSISIVVQRANSRMILEREPFPTKLIMEKLSRCMLSVEKESSWAKRKLNIRDVGNDGRGPK